MNLFRVLRICLLPITFEVICLSAAQPQEPALDPASQKQIDDARQQLEDTKSSILDWQQNQFNQLSQELETVTDSFGTLDLMQSSQIYEGENKLLELEGVQELLIQKYQKSPPKTDRDWGLYREALLQHGALCVDLAKPVQARERAEQAWEAHRKVVTPAIAATVFGARDETATCFQLSLLSLGSDRPQEARRFLELAWTASNRLKLNPLKSELLLLSAMIANLEHAYLRARDAATQASELFQMEFPKGHPKIVVVQCQLANAYLGLNDPRSAKKQLQQAESFLSNRTQGTKQLHAEICRLLAHLNLESGNVATAMQYAGQSSKLYKELFSKFRNSHPNLIVVLSSLSELFSRYEQHQPAVQYAKEAWIECQKRFRDSPREPNELRIATRVNYGKCLWEAGDVLPAKAHLAGALEEAHKLYPVKKFPQGHNGLVLCQWRLGSLLGQLGQFQESLALLQKVEAFFQARYPNGHPQFAAMEADIGIVNLNAGNVPDASQAFEAALREDQRQLKKLSRAGADASVPRFNAVRQFCLAGFFSATNGIATADERAFQWTWVGKNVGTRWARARRAQIRQSHEVPGVKERLEQLTDLGSGMRQQLMHPEDGPALQRSVDERERLEYELGELLHASDSSDDSSGQDASELSAQLPGDAVFIQIVRYDDLTPAKEFLPQMKGQVIASRDHLQRYLAFVVAAGQKVRRVELGLAEPIDHAVAEWRTGVTSGTHSKEGSEEVCRQHAEILGQLVWQSIAEHIPANVNMLLLDVDGDLARFPFAAMPKSNSTGILLEDYAIASVPDGQFLKERRKSVTNDGRPRNVLVVGSVDYGHGDTYRRLPGTATEMDAVIRAEGKANAIVLRDRDATVTRVMQELPKVRVAYFGTHASFDEPVLEKDKEKFLEVIRNWKPESNPTIPFFGFGQRFPLSYIGLALAGANEPEQRGQDSGILRGEGILNLDLGDLDLAVLSGCETGLGQHTAGEAVQGLQQAFHYAGCPNVVASLWKINDAASAVFMQEYVNQLKNGQQSSLHALRQAQLAVYRNPTKLKEAFGGRDRNPMSVWAAFVHSGLGALLPPTPRPEDSASPWWIGVCGLGAVLLLYAVYLNWRRLPPQRTLEAGLN
jgi:CHAT domain-containing protein/tetratricopeptide (TPR) repeat protein